MAVSYQHITLILLCMYKKVYKCVYVFLIHDQTDGPISFKFGMDVAETLN